MVEEVFKKNNIKLTKQRKEVYELLKDKLNISKLTFTSGGNVATEDYKVDKTIERCPLCGIALTNGICPKCGYKKA